MSILSDQIVKAVVVYSSDNIFIQIIFWVNQTGANRMLMDLSNIKMKKVL